MSAAGQPGSGGPPPQAASDRAKPIALETLLDPAALPEGIAYGLRQCRHGPMLFNKRDLYVGRSLATYGEFSEAEIGLFRQILRPGGVVIEAGANIGAHTVPLARMVGESGAVVAFEPQRLQFQLLCANLALNGLINVFARCEALGAAPGETRMPFLPPGQPNNFGGVSIDGNPSGEPVTVTTIDALRIARLSLVKVDVEGMEKSVFEGGRETLKRLRPALYFECDRRDRAPALLDLVLSLGYRAFWHLPYFFNPDNFTGNATNVFPGVISINVLALPADRIGAIDLLPVKNAEDWPAVTLIPDASSTLPAR